MYVQQRVKRKAVALTFSTEFEALLLNYPTEHLSLTYDLELAVQRGLELLKDLEDVCDLNHTEPLHELVAQSNRLKVMGSPYFKHWQINVAEDLLDEVDLVLLAHGDDLEALGLKPADRASVIILLALAGTTYAGA